MSIFQGLIFVADSQVKMDLFFCFSGKKGVASGFCQVYWDLEKIEGLRILMLVPSHVRA